MLSTSDQEKALVGAFSVIVKTYCETDGSFYSTNRGATPRQLGPRYLVVHEYKCSITTRLDHQHTLLHQLHHCDYHFYPTNPAILYITTWFFSPSPKYLLLSRVYYNCVINFIYSSSLDSSDAVEEDGETRVAHTVGDGDGDSFQHSEYFIIFKNFIK